MKRERKIFVTEEARVKRIYDQKDCALD